MRDVIFLGLWSIALSLFLVQSLLLVFHLHLFQKNQKMMVIVRIILVSFFAHGGVMAVESHARGVAQHPAIVNVCNHATAHAVEDVPNRRTLD